MLPLCGRFWWQQLQNLGWWTLKITRAWGDGCKETMCPPVGLGKRKENRAVGQEATLQRSVLLTLFFFLNHMETFHHGIILEKCESKLDLGISSHRSEWFLSKALQTGNGGEVLEKNKFSYTDAGNVNCQQPEHGTEWRFLKWKINEWQLSLTLYRKETPNILKS